MIIECNREQLKQATVLTERLTTKQHTLPVLSKICLEAGERFLFIRSTNLDVGLEIKIPAKVEKVGQVLVTGSVLSQLLANNNADSVKLSVINEHLVITTPQQTSLVKVLTAEDFPGLPKVITKTNHFTIETEQLVSALKTVALAAALNEIKPEIASVYCFGDEKGVWGVATDSFRLAEKSLLLKNPPTVAMSLLLPIRNVTEIIRVFEGLQTVVTVSWQPGQVSFTTDNFYLTSRLIDGIFPDYRQIVPTAAATTVTLNREELLNALKVSQIFTDRLNYLSCRIRPDDKTMELVSQNGEVGENTSLLETVVATGEELSLSLNLRYLLDGVQVLATQTVTLRFNGKTKPIALTGDGNKSFLYLIMPLNR